jgi:hypothetical protein
MDQGHDAHVGGLQKLKKDWNSDFPVCFCGLRAEL